MAANLGKWWFALVILTLVAFRIRAEQPLRIGENEGALYDGILDGYPGVAFFDGVADLSDNPPSVALKFGVLEMRAIAEFPMPSLGRDQIERVELEFNIDDVIATFGPGADFSGRAASRILVHPYCGDGHLDLEDFSRTQTTALEIDTTRFGPITDAVIARNGPIVLSVDATEAVRNLEASNCHWVGLVFRTLDNNTATSIDDLGDGGSYGGSKGAHGAFLPRLLVHARAPEPTPTATPTLTLSPTPTPAGTPSPTASPRASLPAPSGSPDAQRCAGDCDRNRSVTVEEILFAVRIALELDPPGACPAADVDGDGSVTVTDIVRAVQAALEGCP
ncbi:MAG: hypothetical protein KatS3mg077_2203 [Candidatus Binatia bacterium]|nr:MAG: hypothetical protein KatS3mg077_2203 [Candidatus Binatia bacterium]